MKTSILSLLSGAFLCFSIPSFAQSPGAASSEDYAFPQNANVIGAGIGFGGGLSNYSFGSGWSSKTTPSFMASFDHAVIDNFGMGGIITYSTATETSPSYTDDNPTTGAPFGYNETWKITEIGFLIRGTYHLKVNSKFDPYAGLGYGYMNITSTYSTTDPYFATSPTYKDPYYIQLRHSFGYTAFIGARFFFTNWLGLWAEVAYSKYNGDYGNIGIAFRF